MSYIDSNGQELTGVTLYRTLRGHKSVISQIAWSVNGQWIASSSFDSTVQLWDMHKGQSFHTLRGHSSSVNCAAWSHDGRILASGSRDNTIHIWDSLTGRSLETLGGHLSYVNSLSWSPRDYLLASGSEDNVIRIWSLHIEQHRHIFRQNQDQEIFREHSNSVNCVAWSPNGYILASCSDDNTICLRNTENMRSLRISAGKTGSVLSLVWSPNGEILASTSSDGTIKLWNPFTGMLVRILEGHSSFITCVSFSYDGHLIASKSGDGTVRIWRTDIWETITILEEPASYAWLTSLAFHPNAPFLATLDEEDTAIRIWKIDTEALLKVIPSTPPVHYMNAKVVLVGDSGVGKSGLSLVLTGKPFVPTLSTHNRYVWPFETHEVALDSKRTEKREVLLWDLAGQPGYRLIHQLHLNEVVLALVVFDAHNETDPFAGVSHWVRALKIAERTQNNFIQIKKFLVAARIDRGGAVVSRERINTLMQNLGLDEYFETSAKEGKNIASLVDAIIHAIDWEVLPKVTSTELFQVIRQYLLNTKYWFTKKKTGQILTKFDDLFERIYTENRRDFNKINNLDRQFEACIGRIEAQGLIRRLSFGNLVLLQPELLDSYASALVNAVRDEPDGLGSIPEEKVRLGEFYIPRDERILDREQEKLLLIALIEDLIRYEIVLREQGDDGPYLVFPSQSTRENPNIFDPEGKAVIFTFEGPTLNIYATLAVRLAHSGLFKKKELWRNAVIYTTNKGGTYGILLQNMGEGSGEFTLFYDKKAAEGELRFYFEEYIKAHLQRRALQESIQRRRVFSCSNPSCETTFTDTQVKRRRELGYNWIRCSVCETILAFTGLEEEQLKDADSSLISEMDHVANLQRELSAATSILQGKIATHDFDVFLCYNEADRLVVKQVGEQLKENGILPWFDQWELPPGRPWQPLLETQIGQIKSAAVFVGKDGIGPWQRQELDAFLREFVGRGCPVIPVLLEDALKKPVLPIFLKGMTWVDFHSRDPDPIELLIWGITGKRTSS
jgi:WD40 repeat protein